MEIRSPDKDYLEKAKQLSDEEAERLLSRMVGKLPKRYLKHKLTKEEVLAIQLELGDEQLHEWRAKMNEINSNYMS